MIIDWSKDRQDIILQLVVPVCKTVKAIFRTRGRHVWGLVDDAASHAVIEMMRLVDKIKDKKITPVNLTGYVLTYTRHTTNRFITTESMIPIPRSTISRFIKKGAFQFVSILDIDNMDVAEHYDPLTLMDTIDSLISVITTDAERRFVILRLKGVTDCEIAKQLGCSTATISRLKNKLFRKFQRSTK